MNRRFSILYFGNLTIIIIALLAPVTNLLIHPSVSRVLTMQYYAVLIVLSVTFCISFLCLNIYGALKQQSQRSKYIAVIILLSLWIIWGAYQIIYGYQHEMSL